MQISLSHLQPKADQLLRILACQMTSGDLVDLLIVMLIHRWVQRWEVDGVVLQMMRIHRHRATHLEIRISTLEVSIISLEWIDTMKSSFFFFSSFFFLLFQNSIRMGCIE